MLIVRAGVLGDTTMHHINHQFSFLYNKSPDQDDGDISKGNIERPTNLVVLELHVYFKHNFGVTSLAGCVSIILPVEPGTYELTVPTWKPIACSGVGETRCRMHDFYLGSCLGEIGPLDPVPTSESESEMVKDTDIRIFSKGGLLTDCSGSIHVRVNIMSNFFGNDRDTDMHSGFEESHQHRVKMRETVDEVLSRVRRNKRGRMARVCDPSNSSTGKARATAAAKERHNTALTAGETRPDVSDKVSSRTAEVLERVRSRKNSASREIHR